MVYKAKLTTLRVHHTFSYICLSTLHDYDVKIPNLTLYGGRKEQTTKFLNLDMVLRNSTPGGFGYICRSYKWVGIIAMKT